jgi:ketosteroid isomerase-like protein
MTDARSAHSLGDSLTRMEALRVLGLLHQTQSRFYRGEETDGLAAVLAEDVVWHVPGSNAIAGTYRGIDEVTAYMTRRRDLANNTFTIHPRELLIGEHHVAALTDGEIQRDGRTERWSTVGLYRIVAMRIAECHMIPFDQPEFDRIWAAPAPQ